MSAAPLDLDKSGMPWDARIHQKGKSTKKDGTWKLQKGIDATLVANVTQELHALMINSTAGGPPSVPTIPSAPPPPVPLPPPGATPPPPVHDDAGIPHSVAGAAPVSVPQPANVGMPNASNPVMVPGVGFRELVAKISAARNASPPRLTADQITSILQQAGAPSLQLLGSMSHLVPMVDALVDAALLA